MSVDLFVHEAENDADNDAATPKRRSGTLTEFPGLGFRISGFPDIGFRGNGFGDLGFGVVGFGGVGFLSVDEGLESGCVIRIRIAKVVVSWDPYN